MFAFDLISYALRVASLALKDHLLALVLQMVLVLVDIHVMLLALRTAPVRPEIVALILQVVNILGVSQNFWSHFLHLAPEFVLDHARVLLVLRLALRVHHELRARLLVPLPIAEATFVGSHFLVQQFFTFLLFIDQ